MLVESIMIVIPDWQVSVRNSLVGSTIDFGPVEILAILMSLVVAALLIWSLKLVERKP